MKENRVLLAMETSGVTVEELRQALKSAYEEQYEESFIEYLVNALTDEGFTEGETILEVIVAKLCNVSSDYLLGLSDVMHPMNN